MAIDPNKLFALWSTDELPACDIGMGLAADFLGACGNAVDRLGHVDPSADPDTDFTIRWRTLVEHRANCPNCNEE